MSKTIFITGASRGFGKLWAEAFLKRGDKVAATARNLSDLDDLVKTYGPNILPIQLDVNNRADSFAAIQKAAAYFGTIDVVINNAGFGLFGTIEETTEAEARAQFETNVFGLLWVTQAILPVFRKQGHGHIVQVSSILGIVTLPLLGIYNASKFAVEGISETLQQEVSQFGIKVSMIEPNGFSTDWAGPSSNHTQHMPEYDAVRSAFNEANAQEGVFGDPNATSEAVLKLIDAENPPLRLFLGKHTLPWATQVYEERLDTWKQWNEVSVAAHGA
ncbi:SDR family NAD(P)-dependent oxidoreductase [Flavobacterium silvaticum]|uniref:SDR family NAD(P)-dependent oxidoreductase n=1 Tax=Flavobacterium silvaticum TaxID=1852020 RepID=A0A972JI18_9FLAO|nr:SDR family NAD(P)-dependent oxidoreductase [Flavobacterium silvaticum]NMH28530.1 SDR family NAD(P)-dependent oxidoreductase [Flavobacterium silvaticum]